MINRYPAAITFRNTKYTRTTLKWIILNYKWNMIKILKKISLDNKLDKIFYPLDIETL